MRALLVLLILVAATLAHGDVSIDAQRSSYAPRTPLGPRCDAALAAAQARFHDGTPSIDFHVRQQRVVGEYSWSDMCGVWGTYRVELSPDSRPPQGWRWVDNRGTDEAPSVHHKGTRRASGWRATLVTDGDSDGGPGDYFVESFRPAVDICLDAARSLP